MTPAKWLVAIVAEVWVLLLLASNDRSFSDFVVCLCAHALACTAWVLVLYPLLPLHLRRPRGWVLGLMWVLAFFVPVLGFVGVLAAVLTLRWLPTQSHETFFRIASPPEFLLSVREPARLFRGLSVRHLLVDVDAAVALRTRALNAIASQPARIAGDLLRRLLSDPVEDLRLVAYGLLDSQEKTLRRRIATQTERLASLDSSPEPLSVRLASRAEVLRHLAELNFELVYQSLVQGDVREHTLERAMAHAQEALALDPHDVGLRQLQARMHLARGEAQSAHYALMRASDDGLPVHRVGPYMAEMAFARQDWESVREAMQHIDPLTVTPRMAALVRYWQAQSPAQTDPSPLPPAGGTP